MKNIFILISLFLFWCCTNHQDEGIPSENEAVEEVLDEEVVELNPPIIQTPEPLIHLADNLDEQDNLGWCIDTVGRDFNSELHAHSCKPDGGDVQFYYNEETFQICSAEFFDFCLEMIGGPIQGMSLSLVISNPSSPNQKFHYDIESSEFKPKGDDSLCLAVGATSVEAGPYMSRSLTLETSETTDIFLKKWIIKGTSPTVN